MSTVEWGIVGYGVCVDQIETTVDCIEEMLSYAPEFQKDVHEYFEECEITEPVLDDYLGYDQDYMTGIAYLIGKVVEEAEGINLSAEIDGYGICYVMFPGGYPWHLNQKEKTLTEEQMRSVFAKYVSILTEEAIDVEYINTTNFG